MGDRSVPEFAAYLITLGKSGGGSGGSSGFTVNVFDGVANIADAGGITAIIVKDVMVVVGANEFTANVIQGALLIA